MFKYTKEELIELKNVTDFLHKLEGNKNYELTPELLEQLVFRFWRRKEFLESMVGRTTQQLPTIDEDLFSEPFNGACGCLGPQDGELYCGCTMNSLGFRYRYDIALKVLETD